MSFLRNLHRSRAASAAAQAPFRLRCHLSKVGDFEDKQVTYISGIESRITVLSHIKLHFTNRDANPVWTWLGGNQTKNDSMNKNATHKKRVVHTNIPSS